MKKIIFATVFISALFFYASFSSQTKGGNNSNINSLSENLQSETESHLSSVSEKTALKEKTGKTENNSKSKSRNKIFREVAEKTHEAVTPVESGYFSEWNKHVEERLLNEKFDLIFLGDSITQMWRWESPSHGMEIWDQYYSSRKVINMGICDERTQHVLWRVQTGNIGYTSPKVVVFMMGINNLRYENHTAEEISDGLIAICYNLRKKLRKTKILLLAIFPYGPEPGPDRERMKKASLLASRIADNNKIHYLDINDKFLDSDGNLSPDIFPDYLHPNANGYKIWAEAIEPKLKELLGE